jgi:hypothetical protein
MGRAVSLRYRRAPVHTAWIIGTVVLAGTLALLTAATVLALGACADAKPAAPAPDAAIADSTPGPVATTAAPDADVSGIDPCTVLSRKEIEQVTGRLEEQPRAGRAGTDENSCVFHGTRLDPKTQLPTGHFLVVGVAQRSAYGLERIFQGGEPLAGLGDDAFVVQNPGVDGSPGYAVWAAKGGRALWVSSDADLRDGVLALARTLLARI